jgi:glycosyltransferase involved in cell wall biosynthesis
VAEPRVLVVIPAHNEEQSLAHVLLGLRRFAPEYDRVVINDGSTDATAVVTDALGEKQLRLPCNLGYGPALQTGMKYALRQGYEVVVTLDADGQHRPEDVPGVVRALLDSGADMIIGSRFCDGRSYDSSLDRRLGQIIFSHLTRLLAGRRIYDTTSGFKALRAAVCALLVDTSFMDFHTETIVRLGLLGMNVVEAPIIVRPRVYGHSMHSLASAFQYPVKTLVLVIVAAMDVLLTRRAR